jgi:hypothetical protein
MVSGRERVLALLRGDGGDLVHLLDRLVDELPIRDRVSDLLRRCRLVLADGPLLRGDQQGLGGHVDRTTGQTLLGVGDAGEAEGGEDEGGEDERTGHGTLFRPGTLGDRQLGQPPSARRAIGERKSTIYALSFP